MLHRSVAACLAELLGVDVADVPAPEEDHPDPWTVWRNWLGQRGLGLVPIREPRSFNWPGPWLALLPEGDGRVAAVAFGSPPGIAWAPTDRPAAFDAVESGYVIAPSDVALWEPVSHATTRVSGTVEAIAIAQDREAAMTRVEQADAHAGRGLEGDRYFERRGTFTNVHGRGHDLTLIEAEALDELELPAGPLAAQDARRNVVTRGVDLNALVGRHFRIGDVECFGQRLCEPCAHLERLTTPGSLRALIHKGGLRADVLSDGRIAVGDPIAAA
jgi:MOSC domain-containing protein YiiM